MTMPDSKKLSALYVFLFGSGLKTNLPVEILMNNTFCTHSRDKVGSLLKKKMAARSRRQ